MIQVERCQYQALGRITNFEAATQEFPLNQDEMKKLFSDQNQDAYAAYVGKKLVGHTLIAFHKPQGFAKIISIGSHPDFRRAGVFFARPFALPSILLRTSDASRSLKSSR